MVGGFALIALLSLTLSWGSPDAAHGRDSEGPSRGYGRDLESAAGGAPPGIRVASHHPGEDVRYAQLRREWGDSTSRRMFGFYQLQGVLQAALAAPFLIVFASSGTRAAGTFEGLGISSGSQASSAALPTGSWRGFGRIRPGAGASARKACGTGPGIPTTSLNGWSGWVTRRIRAGGALGMGGTDFRRC